MNKSYTTESERIPFLDDEKLFDQAHEAFVNSAETLIVLDDDPTGCQTVHDVPVITGWSVDAILKLLQARIPVFFILTNSRALSWKEAGNLAREIGRNIKKASIACNQPVNVISRSDSTLRGHYPLEVNELITSMEIEDALQVIAPAFFEGGRYTIDDIHYVRNDDVLIPAGESEYARDPSFGFQASDLKDWVREKWNQSSYSEPTGIASLSIEMLRTWDVEKLSNFIFNLSHRSVLILNAFDYCDLLKALLALREATFKGQKIVYRTAASFVKAFIGQKSRPLLDGEQLRYPGGYGGLVVAGSFVPKTSAQLKQAETLPFTETIEVDVSRFIEEKNLDEFLDEIARKVENLLNNQVTVVLQTSRKLVKGNKPGEHIGIGGRISAGLVSIIRKLNVAPAFFVAKGGITSSDIATKALEVEQATVMGQILPGVPVWKTGVESKFPGMPYIIFPGNVGDVDSLQNVLVKLNGS